MRMILFPLVAAGVLAASPVLAQTTDTAPADPTTTAPTETPTTTPETPPPPADQATDPAVPPASSTSPDATGTGADDHASHDGKAKKDKKKADEPATR